MKTRQQKIQQRAQQRKQRREGAERSNFTKPITGKQARHISKAEANSAYGETDRQIKGQIRASGQQQARVGDWYDQFANEIAASRGEVAGAYDKANTAIAGNIQAASADNTSRNAALAAQDAQFAQLTGGPQNTAGPQTDAAAQGQRDLYASALAAPVQAQGANAFAYLTNQKDNARGEGIHQKIQERKRRQSLQQDRKALLKEKGQYRVSKLDELRSREQARADERWKVNKAFPLEKQAAAADAADTAHDNALGDRNAGIAQQNANTSKYNAHHESGAGGGRTPSERRGAREGRQNALQRAREFIRSHGFPEGPEAHAELVEKIEEGEGIGPKEARWAIARLEKKNKGGNRGIPGTTKTPYAP